MLHRMFDLCQSVVDACVMFYIDWNKLKFMCVKLVPTWTASGRYHDPTLLRGVDDAKCAESGALRQEKRCV